MTFGALILKLIATGFLAYLWIHISLCEGANSLKEKKKTKAEEQYIFTLWIICTIAIFGVIYQIWGNEVMNEGIFNYILEQISLLQLSK